MSQGAGFAEQPAPKKLAEPQKMGLTKSLAAIIASERLMHLVCSCSANMFASPFEDNAVCATQLGRGKKRKKWPVVSCLMSSGWWEP